MSAEKTSIRPSGAVSPPAAAARTPDAPPNHPPIWRSVAALADSLNAGASRPTFTSHSIRHYVRFAAVNGLAPHIRRLGSKILIDETGFRAWIDRQGQEAV
jgi:hypothetical protein